MKKTTPEGVQWRRCFQCKKELSKELYIHQHEQGIQYYCTSCVRKHHIPRETP